MKTAVFYGAGDVRIEERERPAVSDGEVLLRVTRSGVCGTDASEWKAGPKVFPVDWRHPASGHEGPLILGHEFIGVVEETRASGVEVGARVASGAGVSCGRCQRCEQGRTNLCVDYRTYGLNIDGGMAEYVAVDATTLVPIPDELDDDAAGLAQPLAVGLHAARRSGVAKGDKVVLIGAGAIGTFVLAGLKHLYDSHVTVIDFSGSRLDRARRLGADVTVAVDADGFDVEIASRAKGVDVVIEASGARGQINLAIGMVRDGGTLIQVGLPAGQPEVDIHQLVFREITMRTTLAHVCREDMPDAMRILAETSLAGEMLDSVRSLEELPEQLDRLSTGAVEGKILFDPSL